MVPKLPRAQCQSGGEWGVRGGPGKKRGGGTRGFPAQMQMRHGTNYLIGMELGGGGVEGNRISFKQNYTHCFDSK